MKYDAFICHASEDKNDFVRPLAQLLQQQHLEIWYDEFSLSIGDSLTQKIDEGLANSKFAIVVLSSSYFDKPWAIRELNGFSFREMLRKENIILPIWHRVTAEEVAKYSLPLADKKAISSQDGINVVIRELIKKIRPQESPLLIAKEYLKDLNVDTPVISDEWWLDIIEYKEFLKFPDLNSHKRWIFPLPHDDDFGKNRGYNIASTVLQMDWSFEGEEMNISPIIHPEIVHEYIRKWSGLYDCARQNPEILALYVPQLTIRGFDKGFEDVFDELLEPNNEKANILFSYGDLETILGKKPLCGNVIAFRHKTFGNYSKRELAKLYFSAHDTTYSRSSIDSFEGLIWLLSDDSKWLPKQYHSLLLEGLIKSHHWFNALPHKEATKFIDLIIQAEDSNDYRMTEEVVDELSSLINEIKIRLSIKDNTELILERLLKINVIKNYYEYKEQLEKTISKIRTLKKKR